MTAMDTSQEKDLTGILKKIIDVTKNVMNKENLQNNEFFDITRKFEDLNKDERFFVAVAGHVGRITEVQKRTEGREPFKFLSTEEFVDYQISMFFMKKYKFFDVQTPTVFQSDYVEQIPNIPLEYFIKPDENAVSRLHRNFTKYDILYGQVIESIPAENLIKLRIICKIDQTAFVYPFNIHAVIFREQELTRLGLPDIALKTILKVFVLGSVSQNGERKIFTTTNETAMKRKLDQNVDYKLGIVPSNELPFDLELYEKVSSKYSSYAQYLRSLPLFHQAKHLKEAIQSTGMDLYRIYSFSEGVDNLSFPANKCIDAIKDKVELEMHLESKKYVELACKYIDEKKIDEALKSFELALECWPKNHKVFEKRGKLYASMMNKSRNKFFYKAVKDFESCLALNPSAYEAKVEYSNIFTFLAKIEKKTKNSDKAKKYLDIAMQLNKENEEAKKLAEKIEKSIQHENVKNYNVIRELEKKKEKIQLQLKSER